MKRRFFQAPVVSMDALHVWMHYMDAYKTYGEKAWRQLHKNATSNSEQVLEAAPDKAAAVRPLTTHHELNMRSTAGEVGMNS